jgi:hypothetical protein
VLEWTDLLLIIACLFVFLIVFLRLVMWGIRRMLPQMVPELMGQVEQNIPNIKPMQAIGYGIFEFLRQGGVQMIVQKFGEWMGVTKPPTPPPPGG